VSRCPLCAKSRHSGAVPRVSVCAPAGAAGASASQTAAPTEIVDALNKEVIAALAEPALQARLADLGIAPMPLTPAECQIFITAEVEKWAKVIKFASIKPE
jgi:tripartite-type tricarboxylate transporter receptor subunit TctC